MLLNILIACALLILTTGIHATFMAAGLQGLKISHAGHWASRSHWTRSSVVAALALIMFVAAVFEAAAWAVVYLVCGAVSGVERALYFSMVTYTTVGYGDLVVEEHWRLLASLEAANGIIMFGWTTALIFAAVQRVYFVKEPD